MNTEWKKTRSNNLVLLRDGFAISYNPDTSKTFLENPVVAAFQATGERLGLDEGGEETALVKGSVFLILKGDWRKEYEKCGNHWGKCLGVYEARKAAYGSNWSTRL